MNHFGWWVVFLFGLLLLGPVGDGVAGEEPENRIDLFESKDTIIALIDGERSVPARLRSDEKILWQAASGRVGALLTDQRILCVSARSRAWSTLSLGKNEAEDCHTDISENLALVVSEDRAIAFNARTGSFIQERLRVRETVVKAGADREVAVVVLSGRVLGIAPGMTAFAVIPFHRNESMNRIQLSHTKAVIHTDARLLSFSSGLWHELGL